MLTSTNIDNIVALFKTKSENMPKISPNGERPSYTTLRKFQEAINDNAMAIPSPNDELGHLGLVISKEEYKKHSSNSTDYEPPTKPDPKPTEPTTTRSTSTNVFEAQEALRCWMTDVNTYNIHAAVKNALRKQILQSVHKKFISELESPVTKFLLVEPRDILNHLWDNYGAVDETDLIQNEERMKKPWSPPTPIEDLFGQLAKGQKFARKGGGDISDIQLVHMAYGLIESTGMFTRELTE